MVWWFISKRTHLVVSVWEHNNCQPATHLKGTNPINLAAVGEEVTTMAIALEGNENCVGKKN